MPSNNQKNHPPGAASVIHRAGWVLVDCDNIIENGYVKTESGKITAVGRGRGEDRSCQVVDHGPGVLMPCLVNAHTHLELSALKNKTDTGSGFVLWVRSVIEAREALGEEKLLAGVLHGINELSDSGALVAGEISSLKLSRKPFLNSILSGVWFQEHLGGDRSDHFECRPIRADQSVSVAGHALHTTAPDLLIQLKSAARRAALPFSLHLAESPEEMEFISTGKGGWADFLFQRGIDTSAFQITGNGPVECAAGLGLLDDSTLAVHLVFADKKDIRLLAEKKVNVCVCARSNRNLHRHLPDVPQMIRSGVNVCLGTDSLASNDSLSLFDEMKFLSEAFSGISPKKIIAMATFNGAAALGLQKQFGQLAPGKMAKMIYLPVRAKSAVTLLDSIVCGDFTGKVVSIYGENAHA